MEKYIFPNSCSPDAAQLVDAANNLFVMEDWHNFGAHYYKTLVAWKENFDRNWHKIKHNYDERFKRMFDYYFSCAAGNSKTRGYQLWQIVFLKKGVPGGYESIR